MIISFRTQIKEKRQEIFLKFGSSLFPFAFALLALTKVVKNEISFLKSARLEIATSIETNSR